MDWLCRSRGRRTAAKSRNAAGARVQLLSENNLAGGVLTSREGRRMVKARLSRWSEEKGRERRERFDRKNSRESRKSQVGSRKYCDRGGY